MDKKRRKVLQVTLTEEEYVETLTRYTKVESQYKEWRHKLETSLPGQLGDVGSWLNHAERLMEDEELAPLKTQEETCSSMKRKLEEHMVRWGYFV